MKKNDNEKITADDVLDAIGQENVEENLYKLMRFLTKDRLIELKKVIRKQCKSKFIIPLRKNNSNNIKKLYLLNDNNFPKESCNFLNQSYMTIKSVKKLIKNNSLVDSNTLLRSAFENLIMGMMIYLDSNVYDEFKKLGLKKEERVYTQQKLRNLFKNNLKIIDKNMFKEVSNRQIQKILDEYYNKLCLFTHSSLIVNEMVEGTLNNDEDLFIIVAKQNMYFLEVLLNCCLKFITKDKSDSIQYDYMIFGWYILISDIDRTKYTNEYLSKYNELLYENINEEYLSKNKSDLKMIKKEIENLEKLIKENPIEVIGFLEELLNK